MASKLSHTTIDHDEIRNWVEAHGGHPASVIGTGEGEEAGILRIDFEANGKEDRLEEISWGEFFKKFDEKNLAFIYQDRKKSGEDSTFFKFVDRDSVELDEPARETEIEAAPAKPMRDPNVVHRLNEIMAVHLDLMDVYDTVLGELDDEQVAQVLRWQCGMHEEHVLELENLILGYGGEPMILAEGSQSEPSFDSSENGRSREP